MNRDLSSEYSEYLRLNGHRVLRTASALWVNVRPGVFQTAPPLPLATIHSSEIKELFKSGNVLACRWFSAEDDSIPTPNETDPVLYLTRPPYDLSSLDRKARNKTRRGLERVEVRKTKLDERTERLAHEVYADNVRRLGIFSNAKQIDRRWQIWVNTIRKASCVEFWSAWHEASLVAFTVAVCSPFGTELVMQRSSHSALDLHPNNALIYTVTKDAFDRGAPLVSFGLKAFGGDRAGSLHRFKVGMAFKGLSLQEHREWHPWFRPFGHMLNQRPLHTAYQVMTRVVR